MISFRVSQREFELLRTKSEAEGARSISDFARLAVFGSAGGAAEFHRLTDDMQQLSAELRRITELLEASRQPARPAIALTTRKTRGA